MDYKSIHLYFYRHLLQFIVSAMDREKLVAINNGIALHASRKELAQAMRLYEQAIEEDIANSHTYAAIINANIRCGSVDTAEQIMEDMSRRGRKRDVILCTTMMKGYCLDGMLSKAVELLLNMTTRSPVVAPNIRTINTILRGCVISGNVDVAEMLLNKTQKEYKLTPDVSTWEYCVILYSQALRLSKVLPIVGRLKSQPDMASGMMNIQLCTARAAAILGDFKVCRKAIAATRAELAKDRPLADGGDSSGKEVLGGKRAWRASKAAEEHEGNSSRDESLQIYREHQRGEAAQELDKMEAFLKKREEENGSTASDIDKALLYVLPHYRKLFSFSRDQPIAIADVPIKKHFKKKPKKVAASKEKTFNSESDTDNEVVIDERQAALAHIYYAAESMFGLDAFSQKNFSKNCRDVVSSIGISGTLLSKQKKQEKKTSLKRKLDSDGDSDCSIALKESEKLSPIETVSDLFLRYNDDKQKSLGVDGFLNFEDLFENSQGNIKMEVCSGAGEWIVAQVYCQLRKIL